MKTKSISPKNMNFETQTLIKIPKRKEFQPHLLYEKSEKAFFGYKHKLSSQKTSKKKKLGLHNSMV